LDVASGGGSVGSDSVVDSGIEELDISDSEAEFPAYQRKKNPQSLDKEESEIQLNSKIPITSDYVLKKVIKSHYYKPS